MTISQQTKTVNISKDDNSTKNFSVLIVDDDEGMCVSLQDIFTDKGYAADMAQDGQSGIDALRKKSYDLILIDIMMPGMNGVETLRQIKSINPNVSTIIMTGNSRVEEFVSESLWAGVDGVLYKPFEIESVIDLIEHKRQAQTEAPTIDLKRYRVDPGAIKMVPKEMAQRYSLMPLKVENGYLLVAMADPANLYGIEDLRIRTGLRVKAIKAPLADIESAQAQQYQDSMEIDRQIERITVNPLADESDTDQQLVGQTPVVRAVELMLQQAVRDQASDIHIEPGDDQLIVRYRIDGVMQEAMRLPLRVHAPILSRIKVISKLNIAERRRPQDGQFSMTVEGKPIDFRVATINTVRGEMAVLRVLDKSISVRGLEEIGFLPDTRQTWEKLIRSPWGIILIAGPTGSGKTSTLYASLNQIDKSALKIITIEDPVEYRFPGISQVQVNRQADLTFASGLRASMRLDPNVILVGEIRDQETARTAVQASLTGHLVFSSIHANDTVGAIFRLIDLGVEPFLLTSSLLGIVSQRLVRRVCNHCRAPKELSASERAAVEAETGEAVTRLEYGTGCSQCAETGYRGRVAVFELLLMTEQLRRLVLLGSKSDELRQAAVAAGMRTMRRDGMLKANQGITTPAEILREIFVMD